MRVLGHDVVSEPFSVRRAIGLAGQFAAVEEVLIGRENLVMVGRLYGRSRREAAARADAVLERFDLAFAADRRALTYSGGMRRRLDLAATLVGPPGSCSSTSRRADWTRAAATTCGGSAIIGAKSNA